MSVNFDEDACGGGGAVSEEDSETRSICSLGSSPSSPQELLSPCSFTSSSSSSSSCTSSSSSPTPSSSPSPQSRPCSLDLPSTVSLSDFGLISPVLGPRSECSGASSPECDLERGECQYLLERVFQFIQLRGDETGLCHMTMKSLFNQSPRTVLQVIGPKVQKKSWTTLPLATTMAAAPPSAPRRASAWTLTSAF